MAKRRRKPIQDVGDPPTPETLAKLKPCPLQVLYAREDIQADEMAAGYRLLEGKQAFTSWCQTQTGKLERAPAGDGEIGKHLSDLIEVYRRWYAKMVSRGMILWPLMDALENYWTPPKDTQWRHHIAVSLRVFLAEESKYHRETKDA